MSSRRCPCRRLRAARRPLVLEALEDRSVPSATDFTAIALFYNLADPAHASNASGYVDTTAVDVNAWLHEGESPTTSQYLHRYWDSLSLGKLQYALDANRDDAGNAIIPTITPKDNNGDDWGDIAVKVLQNNPERIWRRSGGWIEGGVRIIPS